MEEAGPARRGPGGIENGSMRVGIRLRADFSDAAEFLADAAAFDAAGADWLWICGGQGLEAFILLAAGAAVAPRVCLGAQLATDPTCPEPILEALSETIRRLARGRPLVVLRGEMPEIVELPGVGDGPPDRRLLVPAPENRAAWAASLARAKEAGLTGVLAQAGPRLLDILRNPEPGEGRADLQLAQG